MPLLSSSKKAEQFAELLDGSGQGSAEVAKLGDLAQRLSSVPQPRAQFASALRDRLMQEAATSLPAAAASGAPALPGDGGASSVAGSAPASTASTAAAPLSTATGSTASSAGAAATTAAASGAAGTAGSSLLAAGAPLWAQLAAGAAATTIAVTGVGVGASQSLPGDLFYGVKRQVETVQFDLAGGPTDQALAHLGFARARLSEITGLLEGRRLDRPLDAELQTQITELLNDWAGATEVGTTGLLNQLRATPTGLPEVRDELIDFTDAQARKLAVVAPRLSDDTLQSLTGSAFAYLQRVDTALGNPVDLGRLLPSLGLALPVAPGTPDAPASVGAGSTQPSTGPDGAAVPEPASGPSSVPTLPIPTSGRAVPRETTPKRPSVPLPSGGDVLPGGGGTSPGGGGGGNVGGAVGGTVGDTTKTVDRVLEGVTGNGPALKLPTAVPTVPGVGR